MTAAAASGGRIVTPIGNANPAGAACTAAPPRTTCVMPIDALRPGIAAPPAWSAAWAAAASTAGLRSLVSATETDSVTIGARTARTDAVAPLEMSGSGGDDRGVARAGPEGADQQGGSNDGDGSTHGLSPYRHDRRESRRHRRPCGRIGDRLCGDWRSVS